VITVVPPPASLLAQSRLRLATLWQYTLANGDIFRFTDHASTISYGGENYTPTGAPNATATRSSAGLAESTRQFDGAIKTGVVTTADARAGSLDDAQIDEYVVNWQFPWAGAIRHRRYWIDRISFDGERWKAECSGLARFLRAEVGVVLARSCVWAQLGQGFGDPAVAGCKVDMTTFTFTPAVVLTVTSRRRFAINSGVVTGALGADYFTDGTITWVTGANAGLVNEISTHANSGSGAYTFELYTETPFDIAVSDTCTVKAGCDRLAATCKTKFDNFENFRGAPDMPDSQTLFKVLS